MNKINNYNKEEHIQFIEALIKTEQVAVFINNMDISEQSKVEQNDTLEYLYNRIIEIQRANQQLKEMFEDSKTYSKQFLYKHNKNLLEANERLLQQRNKYKEVIEEVREYAKSHFKTMVADEEAQGLLQILDKVKGE